MEPTKEASTSKKLFVIIWALFPVIWLFNLLLPSLFTRIINTFLKKIKGFSIHAGKISFGLFPTTIKIRQLNFAQLQGFSDVSKFLIHVEKAKIIICWNKLLKGKVEIYADIEKPDVHFYKAGEDHYKNIVLPSNWPIIIHQLRITGGNIHYRDLTTTPDIYIQASQITLHTKFNEPFGTANNLLPINALLTAHFHGGTVKANCNFSLTRRRPTFDLNFEATGINLVELNPIFQTYGKFDLHKGSLSIFSEIAAKHGSFKGYIKPLAKDLEFLGIEDHEKSFLRKIWESLLSLAISFFENERTEQVATEIPLSGKFPDVEIHVVVAVIEVLRNAFICSIGASLNFDINIHSVKEEQ